MLFLGCLGFSLMITGVGLGCWFAPELATQGFVIPSSDLLWVQMTGTRELACGLLMLALTLTRQYRALATLMVAFSIIPAGDFFFSMTQGPFSLPKLQHAVGVPGMLVLAAVLWRADAAATAKISS